jgi:hypothetical protein
MTRAFCPPIRRKGENGFGNLPLRSPILFQLPIRQLSAAYPAGRCLGRLSLVDFHFILSAAYPAGNYPGMMCSTNLVYLLYRVTIT